MSLPVIDVLVVEKFSFLVPRIIRMMHAKNYESIGLFRYSKVMYKILVFSFFWDMVYIMGQQTLALVSVVDKSPEQLVADVTMLN